MKQSLAGDMKGRSLDEWIDILGLEQVNDRQIQKPIYRKVRFGPMAPTDVIERLTSPQIRGIREIREMPRTVLAPLLGLHHQVLSRYGKATSKLTVARLIHLCEVLDTSPIELLIQSLHICRFRHKMRVTSNNLSDIISLFQWLSSIM